jgi:glutaredoxin
MWGKKKLQETEQSLQTIPFVQVNGKPMREPITLFALSTCGFCRRALAFLHDQEYSFTYVHMDRLPRNQQDIIRAYVKAKYKVAVSFPFLCIGENDFLTGFIRSSWEKELEELCDEQ